MNGRTLFGRLPRTFCSILTATAMLMATTGTMPANAASASQGTCRTVTLPVALEPGGPENQTVAASYCLPLTWAPGIHEVDVLSPGATYNSMYWDWPQNPSLYSYVNKTLQAGRATFAYDRIGTGGSSHPLSTSVTLQTDAYVLHQIVQWLHRNQGFAQVDAIGHSYGSIISVQEAATYQDVDRLVVTGLLNGTYLSVLNAPGFAYPAALDPHFSGMLLDPGYLTTVPGMRGPLFYSSAADPSVIAYDSDHPDTVTATGLATALIMVETPPALNVAQHVTAPVLFVIGQQDAIFCPQPQTIDCSSASAVKDAEAPYYPSAPSLTAITVPGTGHDLALHPSANISFNEINDWINTH